MSATDKLYFPPTGEETSYFLLVTVSKEGDGLRGRVSVEKPGQPREGSGGAPTYEGQTEGDLAAVIKEADEFAALKGYPIRVAKPDDLAFPTELGTYAERRIAE
ncbi:hypothetical protein [Aureimonas leprariae]|uniref:Uncharacterized protein n=1 Tax=Plantimonas leprariae TaxID=2615207 RepID=A0A7V7PRP1_9HYPH|nr:hypothetical protein [Aureimonas leprariae]KAB0681405.1 hypothetical protein F6X38_05845 [Aureimonas leprariae]